MGRLAAERDQFLSPPPSSSASAAVQETPRSSRSATQTIGAKCDVCFLCAAPAHRQAPLCQVLTKELQNKVEKCARDINNTALMAQIIAYGDLIAQEAKYHLSCLVNLYNSARRASCQTQHDMDQMLCESLAFADLIAFISTKLTESVHNVFVMADLLRLYNARLVNLLGENAKSIPYLHTTRLREKILARMPELIANFSGRDYVLMHNKANLLLNVSGEDQDDNAIGFHRFVKSLRKCISGHHSSFTGEFTEGCEERSVPPALLNAVTMIMYGSKFRQNCGATKPALVVSQLIMMNFKERMPQGEMVRHSIHRETPFPLYTSLRIYGGGRDKALIDEMHESGVSVSHNRVMEVTSQLSRLVVKRAEEESVLCPANLKKGMLTVTAYDNIDFKSRSTTTQEEFHGTGISIFQLAIPSQQAKTRSFRTNYQDVELQGVRSIPALPADFSIVQDTFAIPEKIEPDCPLISPVSEMEATSK